MIKIRIRNAGHEIDVRFPISESELFAKLGEIHAVEGRDAAQSAYGCALFRGKALLVRLIIWKEPQGKRIPMPHISPERFSSPKPR